MDSQGGGESLGITFEIPRTLEVALFSLDSRDLTPFSSSLKKVGLQRVSHFDHFEDAVEFVRSQRDALLILDVRSQLELGLEFIKDLKIDNEVLNFPIIPVVKTGEQNMLLAALKDYGITETVTIPLHTSNLLQAIRRTLATFLPGELENQIQSARTALGKGEIDRACDMLQKLSDKRRSIRTELGLSYISQERRDMDSARRYIKSARSCDPGSFGVMMAELNHMLIENTDRYQLEDFVGTIVKQAPPVNRIGQIFKAFLRSSKAQEGLHVSIRFEKEMSIDPNLKLWQAKLALRCNRLDASLQFLQWFHRSGQKTIESLNMLGVIYKKKKKMDAAVRAFEEASRINPRDFRVLFNLGLAYEEWGDGEKASEMYELALRIHPKFEKAQRRLAAINPEAVILSRQVS